MNNSNQELIKYMFFYLFEDKAIFPNNWGIDYRECSDYKTMILEEFGGKTIELYEEKNTGEYKLEGASLEYAAWMLGLSHSTTNLPSKLLAMTQNKLA